jgi:nucleotide-binding universal stress UspA family protein
MAGTVLCGVNDSAGARNAARVAGALSERLDLRLVLVHVADASTLANGSAGNDESVTTMQARIGGKQLLDELSAEQGLTRAEKRIESGDPAEQLAQVAAEERAALIVVVVPPASTDRASRDPLFLAAG